MPYTSKDTQRIGIEVVGVVASVMGIMLFVGACIRLFDLLCANFNKVPVIVQTILRDSKPPGRSSSTMEKFRPNSVLDINTTYADCERMILKLSRAAEGVERSRKKNITMDTARKLESQRQMLGEGIVRLSSEFRLLNG